MSFYNSTQMEDYKDKVLYLTEEASIEEIA